MRAGAAAGRTAALAVGAVIAAAACSGGTIPPGGKALLTVALKAGSHELWCPVDGHKALGMDTRIQVGGSGSAPSSSPSSGGGSGY
jgi:hypothetical protein